MEMFLVFVQRLVVLIIVRLTEVPPQVAQLVGLNNLDCGYHESSAEKQRAWVPYERRKFHSFQFEGCFMDTYPVATLII